MKGRVSTTARLLALMVIVMTTVRMPIAASAKEAIEVTDPASYTFQSVDVTAEASDNTIEFTDASINEFGTRGSEEYLNFVSDSAVGQIGLIKNVGSTTRYMNTTKGNMEKWYQNVEIIDEGKDGDVSWMAGTGEDSGDPVEFYFQYTKDGVDGAGVFELVLALEGNLIDGVDTYQNGLTLGERDFMENVQAKDLEDIFGGSSNNSRSRSSSSTRERATEESTPESEGRSNTSTRSGRSGSTRQRATETATSESGNAEEATPAAADATDRESNATPEADASAHFPDDSTFVATSQDVTVTWGPELTADKQLSDAHDDLGSYSLTLSMGQSLAFVRVEKNLGYANAKDWLEIASKPDVIQVIDKEAKLLDSQTNGTSAAFVVSGMSLFKEPQVTYSQVLFMKGETLVEVTLIATPEELPTLLETINSSLQINGKPFKSIYTPQEIEGLIK